MPKFIHEFIHNSIKGRFASRPCLYQAHYDY